MTQQATETTKGIKVSGLRLIRNQDGTFTDQYGRVLQEYTNEKGESDLKPIGLDPKGARH